MNKKTKDLITVALMLIVPLPAIKLVMWLIKDYGLPAEVITIAVIYIVLVYPQYNATYALKLINAHTEGEDMSSIKSNKLNWIIFANDIELMQMYGNDTIMKKVISIVLKASLPVMIFSLLYINLLVVFIDLGPTITTFIMYAMLVSITAYVVTKSLVTIYFIYIFKGVTKSFIGIIQPLGFMYITGAAKHYLDSSQYIEQEDSLGINYD